MPDEWKEQAIKDASELVLLAEHEAQRIIDAEETQLSAKDLTRLILQAATAAARR